MTSEQIIYKEAKSIHGPHYEIGWYRGRTWNLLLSCRERKDAVRWVKLIRSKRDSVPQPSGTEGEEG